MDLIVFASKIFNINYQFLVETQKLHKCGSPMWRWGDNISCTHPPPIPNPNPHLNKIMMSSRNDIVDAQIFNFKLMCGRLRANSHNPRSFSQTPPQQNETGRHAFDWAVDVLPNVPFLYQLPTASLLLTIPYESLTLSNNCRLQIIFDWLRYL